MKKTIKLKKYLDVINEYPAGGAINPGMLVSITATGTVLANSEAGGVCEKLFALEDELQGRTIDDAFKQGEPIQCWNAVTGEEVYAWLADGEDAQQGDILVSAGNGALEVGAGVSTAVDLFQYPIAIALEAVDMSSSTGADPSGRIKVRIL